MKTLQKGFSLVELLVVVAIIGVLAGVGIVGYQGYTDSAKERVALANYNSVKRFIDTELVLLNNNIQETSASIKTFSSSCADTENYYSNTAEDAANQLDAFIKGIQCYFEIENGYGNAFKNPYDSKAQVVYGVAATDITKGSINLNLIVAGDVTNGRGGVTPVTANVTLGSAKTGGSFIVTYGSAKGVEGDEDQEKGKIFVLE